MKKLKLMFLWHMHQPYYKDDLEGNYVLPYVRFHGTKDYLDMLLNIEKFPKIKQTFNFVPSLLIQLDDYVKEYRNVPEKDLNISFKNPSNLTEDEKKYIYKNFFKVSKRILEKYPRYNYLHEKAKLVLNKKINSLDSSEILDLQFLYNLAWIDPIFLDSSVIKDIVNKREKFSQFDKETLLNYSLDILKRIIPTYKDFVKKSKIELSMTPFYHPILPLIIDSNEAREARNDVTLPFNRFQSFPDAGYHIREGKRIFEELFDFTPTGIWPAEGSVSDEALRFFIGHGFKWFATDQEILYKTAHRYGKPFNSKEIYKRNNFVYEKGNISGFFRDHHLSDLIGFVYSNWDADQAARDFVNHLNRIYSENDEPVVSVILDGENCWEFYKNDGTEFLNSLYAEIERTDWIECITPSMAIEPEKSQKYYSIAPGSWINGNFDIWIGHEEKNKAWDYLYETRKFLEGIQNGLPENIKQQAWKEIYIAEGSDWFWWFGDDHSSENDETFDYLFRKHLMNVYLLANYKIPEKLEKPIISIAPKSEIFYPMRFLKVHIDGTETTYFDWLNAGYIQNTADNSSMHKTTNFFKKLFFGFDLKNLFIRLDFLSNVGNFSNSVRVKVSVNDSFEKNIFLCKYTGKSGKNTLDSGMEYGWKSIFEAAIPFELIKAKVGDKIAFSCELLDSKGNMLDKMPSYQDVTFICPDEDYEADYWSV